MYTAIIKPRITNWCVCWGPTLRHDTQKEKLNTVTNLVVSLLSSTRRSTPSAALQILYDIPPLDLMIKYEAIALLSRNSYSERLAVAKQTK